MASTALIEQTVATPSGPGPRMSSPVRSISPIAAAVDPIAEGGEQLGKIIAIQGEHQQIIDSVKTHEQAKTDLTQQQLDIQTNNPPQLWASKFKEFADDYQQKTLADPANAHIKDYLAQQLPQITGLMYRDMLEKGVAGTQALQHQQFELMGDPLLKDAAPDVQAVPGSPILPEHYMQRNAPYAKPGPYQTKLSPSEEVSYQKWAKEKGMVADEAGYDMRGFWKSGGQSGYNATAGAMHQPDTFKTPYSESFSNESKYALPNAPHWEGQYLVDEKGNKIFDDKTSKPIGETGVTFQEGDVAKAARRAYYKAIDIAYPNSPDIANDYKQKWEQKLIAKRGEAIAFDTKVSPGLLDAYIKTQKFTPEQVSQLRNIRIGTIEAPYHLATANHEAQVAQTEASLDKQATAHDPGLANAAYQAKLAGFIDTQKYENYTHSKWRDPYATSAPGLVESYLKDIDQNPNRYSAADIAAIPADEISPDDRRKVQAARADGESYAKKAVGGEYLRALDTVRHALTPNIVINKEAVAARVEAALTSLRAAKEEGQFQTTKDVQDFTKQVLATYTVGKPKKPVEHVVAPSAPPVKLPPAIAAKIAAEARASAWEPGE